MKKLKNIIVTLMILFSLLVLPTKDSAQELEIINPINLTIEQQIEYFSDLYKTDSNLIKKVMECESNGDHSNISDGGRSKGIFQFQKPTFLWMEKEFGEDLNYESQFDQIKLATWAIANGYGSNWTAWRAIKNGGTYSFYSNQLHRSFKVTCK
jgi:hypothetical protein